MIGVVTGYKSKKLINALFSKDLKISKRDTFLFRGWFIIKAPSFCYLNPKTGI